FSDAWECGAFPPLWFLFWSAALFRRFGGEKEKPKRRKSAALQKGICRVLRSVLPVFFTFCLTSCMRDVLSEPFDMASSLFRPRFSTWPQEVQRGFSPSQFSLPASTTALLPACQGGVDHNDAANEDVLHLHRHVEGAHSILQDAENQHA